MTVEVDNAVWEAWKELEELRKPSIGLLLTTTARRQTALRAVREAAGEAVAALDPGDDLPDGYDEPRPGICEAMLTQGGIAIQISEGPSDFRGLVDLIVAGVARRGIDGRVGLLAPQQPPELPWQMALVECRMRPLGQRDCNPGPRWKGDPDAMWELAKAGAAWCVENPPTHGLTLQAGPWGPLTLVDPGDDLEALLADAISNLDMMLVRLASVGAARTRMLAVHPWQGRVTLAELSPQICDPDAWQAAVDSQRRFITSHADQLVYAFIKPGHDVSDAALGSSLSNDWPPRPEFKVERRDDAYENEWAPDVLPIQLLGPGYRGRVPSGRAWRLTDLGHDRTLVEHHDLAAWMQFIPTSQTQGDRRRPSPTLTAARADFADILLQTSHRQ